MNLAILYFLAGFVITLFKCLSYPAWAIDGGFKLLYLWCCTGFKKAQPLNLSGWAFYVRL